LVEIDLYGGQFSLDLRFLEEENGYEGYGVGRRM
jgi:hypothetical protein